MLCIRYIFAYQREWGAFCNGRSEDSQIANILTVVSQARRAFFKLRNGRISTAHSKLKTKSLKSL